MNCPACGSEMVERTVAGITVDLCEGGCGGIWFDRYEFMKVDEPSESAGEGLLDVRRNENIVVDHTARRHCPRCEDTVMMRHFFSVKREVELDECPRCAGFYLDAGELGRIRELFESEEEQRRAAREYFNEIVEEKLGPMRAESEERRRKARKIAHMFRFICPSYYIPGKQEWGAH